MSPNINWTQGDDAVHAGSSVVTNRPSGRGSDGGGPGQGRGVGDRWAVSVPSAQFCCESETAPKKESLFLKKQVFVCINLP